VKDKRFEFRVKLVQGEGVYRGVGLVSDTEESDLMRSIDSNQQKIANHKIGDLIGVRISLLALQTPTRIPHAPIHWLHRSLPAAFWPIGQLQVFVPVQVYRFNSRSRSSSRIGVFGEKGN